MCAANARGTWIEVEFAYGLLPPSRSRPLLPPSSPPRLASLLPLSPPLRSPTLVQSAARTRRRRRSRSVRRNSRSRSSPPLSSRAPRSSSRGSQRRRLLSPSRCVAEVLKSLEKIDRGLFLPIRASPSPSKPSTRPSSPLLPNPAPQPPRARLSSTAASSRRITSARNVGGRRGSRRRGW